MPRRHLLLSLFCVALLVAGGRSTPVRGMQADPGVLAESWDAIYMGDAKVGHVHVWIEPVKDGKGRDLRRVRVHYELTLARGSDQAKTELEYGTIETPTGEVLRLDTLTRASKQDIRTHGDVKDGQMQLALEVGGRKTQTPIDWPPDVRGPYGAELSLSQQPMKPGESREVKTYIPDLNKICLTRLRAVDSEEIPLGPALQKRRLLKVEQSVASLEGEPLGMPDSTLWVDDSGQIMKSFTNAFGGMYTYRTTREGAMAPSRATFQLLGASIIKPTQPLSNPETARSIVYRLKGKNVVKLFSSDQRQRAQAEGDDTVTLNVTVDAPTTGEAAPSPDDACLRANPLVDSDDENVRRNARAAVGRQTDPWAKACAIQDWVFKNMKRKNFAVNFAPAAQVARQLEGDCTEHAVLTAAMCRAAGVPARCVVGLVYAQSQGGFGYHMWNEVYVNNRWVAIDAAYNQNQVDPTHLKLLDTSLDGVAPFETFMPVFQVFGNLTIQPIEVRR